MAAKKTKTAAQVAADAKRKATMLANIAKRKKQRAANRAARKTPAGVQRKAREDAKWQRAVEKASADVRKKEAAEAKQLASVNARKRDKVARAIEDEIRSDNRVWGQVFVRPTTIVYADLDHDEQRQIERCRGKKNCLVTVDEYVNEFGQPPQSFSKESTIEVMSLSSSRADMSANTDKAENEGWTFYSAHPARTARDVDAWAAKEASGLKRAFEKFAKETGENATIFVRYNLGRTRDWQT
jgi:hypothetical protein